MRGAFRHNCRGEEDDSGNASFQVLALIGLSRQAFKCHGAKKATGRVKYKNDTLPAVVEFSIAARIAATSSFIDGFPGEMVPVLTSAREVDRSETRANGPGPSQMPGTNMIFGAMSGW
jgi:hypothetical protein